jgi:MFS family permease
MLMMTFLIMGVASFFNGCLPSYDSVGLLAPVGLVFLRFMQGFAFGGEYMNAVSLTLENAPQSKRGFFASWVNASGPIGIIVASGLIAILSTTYGRDEFINWVWRIPFLFSFILVILGTYIRHSVDESLLLKKKQETVGAEKAPLLTVLRSWKKSIVLGCLANMVHSSFQYLSTVFVIGYAVRTLGMSQGSVTSGPMFANIAEMIMVPIIAHYSDRFGRKPFMIVGIVLAAVWFPIFFQILAMKDPLLLISGLVVSIGLIHALMFAPEAAFTAELFPTEVRVSGSSMGKQFGIIFGGGMAPLIATWLMGMWGGSTVPVIVYFEVIAVLAFVGMLLAPENSKKVLD